jgi:hypothetical protein
MAKKPSLANVALPKGGTPPAPVAAIAPPPTEKDTGKKDDRIGQTLRLPTEAPGDGSGKAGA